MQRNRINTGIAGLLIMAALLVGAQATAQEVAGLLSCGTPYEAPEDVELLYPMPFDGQWGYVDRSGEWVIPPAWELVTDFSEGRAVVSEADGYWGVIDHSGAYVLEPSLASQSYSTVGDRRIHTPPLKPFSEGCASGVGGTTSETPFFVDRDGNIHWADGHPSAIAEYGVREFGSFSEGRAWFRTFSMDTDQVYGWIDATGAIVLPMEYAGAGEFVGGLAPAAIEPWSWGYIDTQGELEVPGKWTLDEAWPFSGGVARVEVGPFDERYLGSDGSWAFNEVTLTGTYREELGETLKLITGGAFHSGLAPVLADSDGDTLLVYANSDGTSAFIPETQPGVRVCLAMNRPGFGEFRNDLARLLVANDGEECGDNYTMAELADNEGAHYVYLDTSGDVVLSQSEVAPPDQSGRAQ